jgi:hypothetical protein
VKTIVVHVNSKEWAEAVKAGTARYCGRAVRRAKEPLANVDSAWANPHRIATYHGPGVTYAAARKSALLAYRETISGRLLHGCDRLLPEYWRRELLALDGITLGCWCRDPKLPWDHPKQRQPEHACHCDVLVELLEELKGAKP